MKQLNYKLQPVMIDIACSNTRTKSKIIVLSKSSENRSSEVNVLPSFEIVDVQVIY